MADNVFEIGIGTQVDNKGLKKDLGNAEKQIKDFAGSASKAITGIDFSKLMGPALAVTAVAGIKQVIGALNQWGAAAVEHQRTLETLQGVVESSGAATWTSAKDLEKAATELSNATGKTRDEITQMQTVMLGFQNVTGDTFNEASRAAMNMASVMGGDLRGAATSLGKALESPTKGIALLAKQGMNFTEQQKTMVAELEKAGKLQEAQAILLEKVGEKYGDAASTQNEAALATIKYNNAMEDFKNMIGAGWAEATAPLKYALGDFIGRLVTARQEAVALQDAVIAWAETGMTQWEAQLQSALNRINNNLIDMGSAVDSVLSTYPEYTDKVVEANNKAFEKQAELMQAIQDAYFTGENNRVKALIEEVDAAIRNANKEIENIYNIEERREGFRKKYNEALAESTRQLEKDLELEGKKLESLEGQQRLYDLQINAYRNLLNTSEGLLDGSLEEEKIEERKLFTAQHNLLTQQEELKNLDEFIKKQSELQAKVKKWGEEAKSYIDRQDELKAEEDFQNNLNKTKLEAAKKSQENIGKLLGEKRKQQIKEINDAEEAAYVERANNLAALRTKEINDSYTEQLKALDKLEQEELKKYTAGTAARLAAEHEFEAKRKEIKAEAEAAIVGIEGARAAEEERIRLESLERLAQAERDALEQHIANIQKIMDVANQMASGISSLWNNIIDQQTAKKIEDNKKMVQSDEERAAKEKEILYEAAMQKYKADLFQWSANVTMATAAAALAAATALKEGPYAGPVMMGIMAALGAIQVAAVAAAMPKPPRFHSGGVVQGGSGDIPAVLKRGEVVSTSKQFDNIMGAFANMANMKSGAGGMDVQIINNASNMVTATPQFDGEKFKVLIDRVVESSMGSGRYDTALAMQAQNARGTEFEM